MELKCTIADFVSHRTHTNTQTLTCMWDCWNNPGRHRGWRKLTHVNRTFKTKTTKTISFHLGFKCWAIKEVDYSQNKHIKVNNWADKHCMPEEHVCVAVCFVFFRRHTYVIRLKQQASGASHVDCSLVMKKKISSATDKHHAKQYRKNLTDVTVTNIIIQCC